MWILESLSHCVVQIYILDMGCCNMSSLHCWDSSSSVMISVWPILLYDILVHLLYVVLCILCVSYPLAGVVDLWVSFTILVHILVDSQQCSTPVLWRVDVHGYEMMSFSTALECLTSVWSPGLHERSCCSSRPHQRLLDCDLPCVWTEGIDRSAVDITCVTHSWLMLSIWTLCMCDSIALTA